MGARTARSLLSVASAALLALTAGCTTATPPPGPTPPGPGTATVSPDPVPTQVPGDEPASVVEIQVSADGSLTMPTQLPPGAHVFEVSSESIAQVTIIEPTAGYTTDQLREDFGPHASEQELVAAAARFEAGARLLGGSWSEPGGTWSFARTLDEGAYWFVDLAREPGDAGDDDVLHPARIVTVTVSGEGAGATLPASDAVASVTEEDAWTLPEAIPAAGTLRITNGTTGSHQLVLERVPDGTAPQDWLAQSRAGHKECPCGSPAPVSGGEEFLWVYDLPPGDYVVLDRSIGGQGYPQYDGAGASLVRLT